MVWFNVLKYDNCVCYEYNFYLFDYNLYLTVYFIYKHYYYVIGCIRISVVNVYYYYLLANDSKLVLKNENIVKKNVVSHKSSRKTP